MKVAAVVPPGEVVTVAPETETVGSSSGFWIVPVAWPAAMVPLP